ncbi:hypothetical protein M0813_06937 [Anaeramoeba flamelloides]|uniref:Uncharacterized protein n=1 Tax=Anaeramoeba flamelloides TaxID=1746091 RepID=A0ABQ8XF85_9EUKA|nr:hypothetical protein M0813_06937 [Anaeramoeba flamelloides]
MNGFKAVIFFGSGTNKILTTQEHPNLDWISFKGCSGVLQARRSSENYSKDEYKIFLLSQMFNYYDQFFSENGEVDFEIVEEKEKENENEKEEIKALQTNQKIKDFSSRYGGMKGTILTNSKASKSFALSIGCVPLSLPENGSELAEKIFSLEEQQDYFFVDFGNKVEIIEAAIQELKKQEEKFYFVVASSLNIKESLCFEKLQQGTGERIMKKGGFRPKQSWKMTGLKDLTKACQGGGSIYVSYWKEGVSREDQATKFKPEECKQKGCNLTIYAERFIWEIGYRLGFTPKYGA